MVTMSLSALAATTLVAIAWAAPVKAMNPTTAAPARSIDETAIAQAFPPFNSSEPVLSVTGQGQGSGVADTAEVQLTFVNYSEADAFARFSAAQLAGISNPSTEESFASYLDELEPITQASLQPIVDRLVAAGVPASAIEVNLDEEASSGSPPFPQLDSAQISLRLNRPSPAQIDAILPAAESAIQGNDKLFLQNNLVRYTTANCEALEQAAYQAAIANARDRANRIAAAANVTITGTPSISDNSSSFSSDLDSCNSELVGADNEATATVELQRTLTLTYPIR